MIAWAGSVDGLTVWSPGHDRTIALLLGPSRALALCGALQPIELSWDDHQATVGQKRAHDDWAVAALHADSYELNGMVLLLASRYRAAASEMLEATAPRETLGEANMHWRDSFMRLPIAPRPKSQLAPHMVDERATLNALIDLLADRPELRVRLSDQRRTRQLAFDIGNGLLGPADSAVVHRSSTTEILAAMRTAGLVHPYNRPLPGDDVPALNAAMAAVKSTLARDKHGGPDDEHVSRVLRKYYIDVTPWPFRALLAP